MNENDTIEETATKIEPVSYSNTVKDELEADIEAFSKTKSEHEIEPETVIEQKTQPEKNEAIGDVTSDEDIENFKFQMFFGIFFSLIDGLHLFIYRFISKVEIDKDEFCLSEEDKETFQVYFKTDRVMKIINKLPSELIGFVHLEWLYYERFKEIKETQKLTEKKEPAEKKDPQKKKAPAKRKKPKKKAAPKKQAA